MPRSAATSIQASDETGTRERILEAALACFSESGFEGATTREIARRADVNLGLIQYHFAGKEPLWQAAVDRAFAQLSAGTADALRAAGPTAPAAGREELGALIRHAIRWIGHHPEFVRLMHDEGKRDGPRMRWIVDHHVRPMFDAIQGALRSGQEQGFLAADVDPIHFHYILIGAVALVFHQAPECQRLTGTDPTGDAFIEAHAEAVTRLFLGPPEKETPR